MSSVNPMSLAIESVLGGTPHPLVRPRSPADDDSFAESLWLALIGVAPRLSAVTSGGFSLPTPAGLSDQPHGVPAHEEPGRHGSAAGHAATVTGAPTTPSERSRTDTFCSTDRHSRHASEPAGGDGGSPRAGAETAAGAAPADTAAAAASSGAAVNGPNAGPSGGSSGGGTVTAGVRPGAILLARLPQAPRAEASAGPIVDARARLEAWLDKVGNLRDAVQRAGGSLQLQFGEGSLETGAIRISLRGSTVMVTITASDRDLARRMESQIGDLRQCLADRGFTDTQLSIRSTGSGTGTDASAEFDDPGTDHPGQWSDPPAHRDREYRGEDEPGSFREIWGSVAP